MRAAPARGPVTDDEALVALARQAASLVAAGAGDELLVPMLACPPIDGEQADDGVRAVAAIQVLRHLVDAHEDGKL